MTYQNKLSVRFERRLFTVDGTSFGASKAEAILEEFFVHGQSSKLQFTAKNKTSLQIILLINLINVDEKYFREIVSR